ncbi:KTSC domain-containing protein [Photobacterium sp. DNB23_23_1]|uniref:KTSC domain-containing protein n=1 Tax=Photobacterium pectinilyticum TaxID=2906793 RepID=A0ABT1NAH5_9GAMM|nr:KTSC domain-containing protein [Photobacterium sp. ZSDE20]MCQ1060854.1 KTSC domain-containing protein [Photobacterium sp. ZSDE20]MDD1828677.1 KTSC domain-containing protein [Photobacterium sp. ZSDE20]
MDKFNLFYVNGMFTNSEAFSQNILEIKRFYGQNLAELDVTNSGVIVDGEHNPSESFLSQFEQVAKHKFSELSVSEASQAEIASLFSGFEAAESLQDDVTETTTVLNSILAEIDNTYGQDGTYTRSVAKLTSLLNECKRTMIIGHSQGNFYANALLDGMYSSFTYQDGSTLLQYPMLGYFGFALPTSSVGGTTGQYYFPELVDHITNDNDFIMAAVRHTLGAVPANYNNSFTFSDWTGHALTTSYLDKQGQSHRASISIKDIARQFVPMPLTEQHRANSSSINSYGYSIHSEVLDIEFHDNSSYRYVYVPRNVLEGFHEAGSKGGYFNSQIRDKYQFIKMN